MNKNNENIYISDEEEEFENEGEIIDLELFNDPSRKLSKIEEEPDETHSVKVKESLKVNMDNTSEYYIELKNNNEFINMSRFDEASKAGFGLNKSNDFKIPASNMNLSISPINKKFLNNVKFEMIEEKDDNIIVPIKIGESIDKKQNLNLNSNYNLNSSPTSINKTVLMNSKANSKFNLNLNTCQNINNLCNMDNDEEMLTAFNVAKNSNLFKKFLLLNPNIKNVICVKNDKDEKNVIKNFTCNNLKSTSQNNQIQPKINLDVINNFTRLSSAEKNQKNLKRYHSPLHAKTSKSILFSETKAKDDLLNNYYQDQLLISEEKQKKVKDELIQTKKELNLLRQTNDRLKFDFERKCYNYQSEIEEIKEKYTNLLINYEDSQVKVNNLTFLKNKISKENDEKQNTIDNLNITLIQREELSCKLTDDNKFIKSNLDLLKQDLNNIKEDNSKKNEKISDLQQEVLKLEHELTNSRSKSNSDISTLRESKQNLDLLKANYYEIKNQYELMNMKYQSIADENFNIKRDILLYEKEIKNKNEIIEKLRREILDLNKSNYLSEGVNNTHSNLNLNLNLNNIMKGGYEVKKESDNDYKSITKRELYEKHLREYNEIKPASKDFTSKDKESQIKNIENKMFSLNREREEVNNELNRLPQFPKKREQIDKKNELEEKVLGYGKELAKLKVELKNLTSAVKENK